MCDMAPSVDVTLQVGTAPLKPFASRGHPPQWKRREGQAPPSCPPGHLCAPWRAGAALRGPAPAAGAAAGVARAEAGPCAWNVPAPEVRATMSLSRPPYIAWRARRPPRAAPAELPRRPRRGAASASSRTPRDSPVVTARGTRPGAAPAPEAAASRLQMERPAIRRGDTAPGRAAQAGTRRADEVIGRGTPARLGRAGR